MYLIGGSDRPKVDRAIDRLRRHFDPSSIDRFDAAADDAATVVAACNAGTLFGDLRLVLVDQVDGRPGDDGRLRATWKAADVEEIVAYVRAPAPGTVLALVSNEVKKDAPLVKAAGKGGTVLAFEIEKRKVTAWVVNRFREEGARIDPEAAKLLVDLVGDKDTMALDEEIRKLATWARSDPGAGIGEREVLDLVAPWSDTPPWELTDAWADHDPGRALRTLERILHQAGTPGRRRDEAARLTATLGGHLGKLRRVSVAAAQGERPRDHAERTKQRPFPVEKLFRQVEGMSGAELDDATLTVARLDHALKGGSRLTPELELQLAVTRLSRDRSRRETSGAR